MPPRSAPWNDSTSTDLVLRCYSPQVVARAFQRAASGTGDSRERLNWRLGFVDVAQRFVLGVLTALHAGLGKPPGPAFRRLVDKLQTPSLGDVSRAVEELATSLADEALESPLDELVALFAARGGERTATAERFQALIDLRNQLFHKDGAPIPDEAAAARHLRDTEAPVREIGSALRVLRRLPVHLVEGREDLQDGSTEFRLLRFTGLHPEPRTLVLRDEAFRLPTKIPFVMLPSGCLLTLPPIILVARHAESGTLEMRLLYGWNSTHKAFEYSALDGGARSAPSEGERFSLDSLTTLSAAKMLWRAAVSPRAAEEIAGRTGEEGLPVIAGYRVEGKLGTGASGAVFVARELLTDRAPGPRVAIKVLHEAVTDDPSQRSRLMREHSILSKLQHPGIVKVFSVLEAPRPAIVLEYVEGEDLQSMIERRLPPRERAVAIVEDVLHALEAAHAEGVVHRDVKPSNVLVDRSGRARLIDFGVAAVDDLPGLTRTLDAVGTPDFAAPEQRARSLDVGPAADVYAVGRLLEFVLTGRLDAYGAPESTVPDGLRAIIRKATQREVAWRFGSATEVLDALAERKKGRWEGAPVQQGDRLNDSYELHELVDCVEDLYAFRGLEMVSESAVTIVVAKGGEEVEKRLATLVQQCPDTLRAALGQPRIQRTSDRVLFAVVNHVPDPGAVLAAWLGGGDRRVPSGALPPRSEAVSAPDGTERALGSGGRVSLHEVLAAGAARVAETNGQEHSGLGIPYVESIEVARAMFRTYAWVELVLGVMRAQQDVIESVRVGRQGFEHDDLASGLRDAGHRRWLSDQDLGELNGLQGLRHQLAHGRIVSGVLTSIPAATRFVLELPSSLAALARAQVSGLAPDDLAQALAPRVARVGPNGVWAILRRAGTTAEYVALDGSDARFELTPEAIRWIADADADLPLRAPSVLNRKAEQMRLLEDEVEAQLKAMPFAKRVAAECHARQLGRRLVADFVVYGEGERPLVVVEVKGNLDEGTHAASTMARFEEQVWTLGRAFDAPFVALSDGTRWRWYRLTIDDGMVRLGGPEEIAHGERDVAAS